MALADYYLCDVCNRKAFYDADKAHYDEDGNYSLGGMVVDIAAVCAACKDRYTAIAVCRVCRQQPVACTCQAPGEGE